jgi:hypothetical protein
VFEVNSSALLAVRTVERSPELAARGDRASIFRAAELGAARSMMERGVALCRRRV